MALLISAGTHRLAKQSDRMKINLFGMSKAQVALLAKQAACDAVRAAVQAGHPVTGIIGGTVATIEASGPRLTKFRTHESDARAP